MIRLEPNYINPDQARLINAVNELADELDAVRKELFDGKIAEIEKALAAKPAPKTPAKAAPTKKAPARKAAAKK
ncbi:MAG: hypothetical protein GQ474_00495 [Sulfurimonas sp.]|nr:hypothetical protein [Sulfurimonas sp.]